jgi:ribokinase/sulfofructose kinase
MDLVLKMPHLPAHDEKVLGELVGRLSGGPAANFACASSRLGLKAACWAGVGDDESGRLILKDFEDFGVDTSLMQIHRQAETPFTIVMIDPTGEKAIVVIPTFEHEYSLEIAAGALARSRMLYLMPQHLDRFLALARLAHQYGAEVMIDVEATVCGQRDRLEQILAQTDIASFNQAGFAAAAGQPVSIEAAQSLLAFGPHTVMVTRGEAGSLAVTRGAVAEHPGYRVAVVDTTGAGDTFNAAFLAATLQGKPLEERLQFANAAAAISVTALGARGWLPTTSDIETFLENGEV